MNIRLVASIGLASAIVCTASTAGEEESLRLADALGMEKRWDERVTGPAIESYLERIRKMRQPPPTDDVIDRVRIRLRETLSWARVGRAAVVAAYSKCDDQTLIDMRRLTLKEDIGKENEERTVSNFRECTTDLGQTLGEHLAKAMQDAAKQVGPVR
jgi:hypothetical protein